MTSWPISRIRSSPIVITIFWASLAAALPEYPQHADLPEYPQHADLPEYPQHADLPEYPQHADQCLADTPSVGEGVTRVQPEVPDYASRTGRSD